MLTATLALMAPIASAQQATVIDRLPERPSAGARYVIYLHGRIIEDLGPRPTHPTWGVYEFQQILETIAASGAVVIGEQRPASTDVEVYARHVVNQAQTLLRAGVPAERVSIVGFSKGGVIAIRASALLQHPTINFVFLAACGDGDFSHTDITISGRILSVYETSDEIGRSCAGLFAKAGAGQHVELPVSLGRQHGTFFRPEPAWVTPVVAWIRR
jgi:hypothetical protein